MLRIQKCIFILSITTTIASISIAQTSALPSKGLLDVSSTPKFDTQKFNQLNLSYSDNSKAKNIIDLVESSNQNPFPSGSSFGQIWHGQLQKEKVSSEEDSKGGMDGGGGCVVQSSDKSIQLLDFYLNKNVKDQHPQKWAMSSDQLKIDQTVSELGVGLIPNIDNLRSYQMALQVLQSWSDQGDVLAAILLNTSKRFKTISMTKYIFLKETSLCSVDRDQIRSGDRILSTALYQRDFGLIISMPIFNSLTFTEQVGLWLHELLRNYQIQLADEMPNSSVFAVTNQFVFGKPTPKKQILFSYKFGALLERQKLGLGGVIYTLESICNRLKAYESRLPSYAKECPVPATIYSSVVKKLGQDTGYNYMADGVFFQTVKPILDIYFEFQSRNSEEAKLHDSLGDDVGVMIPYMVDLNGFLGGSFNDADNAFKFSLYVMALRYRLDPQGTIADEAEFNVFKAKDVQEVSDQYGQQIKKFWRNLERSGEVAELK